MRWQYIAHVTPSDGAMTPSDGVTQRHVRGATDPTLLRCNVSAERYGSLRPGACSGSGSGACCWSFSIQIEEPNGAVKRRARPSRKRHREKMYYYCGECGGRLTAPGACAESHRGEAAVDLGLVVGIFSGAVKPRPSWQRLYCILGSE